MAKLTINDVSSGYVSTTALNTAFTAIETALENTLSRDGTSPNQMSANLDMNGYAILNARATTGNENFIWMGTWTTGTVYAVNNLIYAPEGNNLGDTLICISAHTAGATLDGDIAKWAVFAQRGATGIGTGDVTGPASATSDSLARFNGITGKLLKDGAVIGIDVQAYSANLAALSALSTGTSSGNIPLVGTESATDTVAGLSRRNTQAEAEAGALDEGHMTPLKTAQAIAALGFGSGQTWQNVTASRATGTTYTNSTGRPIQIAIALTMTSATSAGFVIGGVTLQGSWSSGSGACSNLFAVVPVGSTYSANGGSVSGILNWSELR